MDERASNAVHDRSGSGLNLRMPKRCTVGDQILHEPFWQEFGCPAVTLRAPSEMLSAP
jgi:hypothetical protein